MENYPDGTPYNMDKVSIKCLIFHVLHTHVIHVQCLIQHTKGPGKCVGLYRMSEYSGFILVNRNTLEP